MVRTTDDEAVLNDLFQHPGWKVLTKRLEQRKDEKTRTLALAMLSSRVDQQLVDETRGFWLGADWFWKETRRGMRAFERDKEDGEST